MASDHISEKKVRTKALRISSQRTIGKVTIIKDFLPSPKELANAEIRVKITIELDESTILFFKKEAGTHNTTYQRMMREILNSYANKYAA